MTDTAEQLELPEVPPAPQQQKQQLPPQTIKAVVIPLDLFNQIHDQIRDAPHRHADPLLKQMANLQIHDVNIGPRNS